MLSGIQSSMVTKEDLKQVVKEEVKEQVENALTSLDTRLTRLEPSDFGSYLNDPARSQVAFVGFLWVYQPLIIFSKTI